MGKKIKLERGSDDSKWEKPEFIKDMDRRGVKPLFPKFTAKKFTGETVESGFDIREDGTFVCDDDIDPNSLSFSLVEDNERS